MHPPRGDLVSCKGLSHPSRVEKKDAPYRGAALLSDASTNATLHSLAMQSLEQRRCLPEEHVKQHALPQLLVPWLQANTPVTQSQPRWNMGNCTKN